MHNANSSMFRRVALGALLGAGLLGFLHSAAAAESTAWSKAADNRIYAQKLVNQLMAEHDDLVVVGMHARIPGAKDETMIATNLDRVGKIDDDDDVAVATEHKTICAPNPHDPHKFEVLTPMKDASGKFIGSIGFVFKYEADSSEVELHRKALALRDWLQRQTPSLEDLLRRAD